MFLGRLVALENMSRQAGWQLWYVTTAVGTHFGGESSRQVAEAMYLQLYRSKLQFYRKFGGERRANRFKTYLRLAYWPRAVIARLVSTFNPAWTSRARTYKRLLLEMVGEKGMVEKK
ncbi:MAG: hypothetical protein GY764_09020 [Halieaceae bacterium]|nr:hypothetical protein [Halieaceae bacterium]